MIGVVMVLDKNCLIETLLIHGIRRPQIQSIFIYINLKLVFNTVKESLRKREGVSQRLSATCLPESLCCGEDDLRSSFSWHPL
jgi:hypothetical protein